MDEKKLTKEVKEIAEKILAIRKECKDVITYDALWELYSDITGER